MKRKYYIYNISIFTIISSLRIDAKTRRKTNKFEMFQTIISFINLIPTVFELAYVQYIKLKSRFNL